MHIGRERLLRAPGRVGPGLQKGGSDLASLGPGRAAARLAPRRAGARLRVPRRGRRPARGGGGGGLATVVPRWAGGWGRARRAATRAA
jgi:hypothetical protein